MTHAPTREQIEEWLRPPTQAEVELALAQFAANVRSHYSNKLRGLYLFGSRARGDHRPDSDADVAVVLQDGDWVSWKERRMLSRLAYEPSLESGLAIQAWPFSEQQWGRAEGGPPAPLVEAAKREAVVLR